MVPDAQYNQPHQDLPLLRTLTWPDIVRIAGSEVTLDQQESWQYCSQADNSWHHLAASTNLHQEGCPGSIRQVLISEEAIFSNYTALTYIHYKFKLILHNGLPA